AGDIAHPAFDHLPGKGADQLAENAAADRAGNGVSQGAERILLGCGARRAAADRARYELNDKSREIHVAFPPQLPGAYILGARLPLRQQADELIPASRG